MFTTPSASNPGSNAQSTVQSKYEAKGIAATSTGQTLIFSTGTTRFRAKKICVNLEAVASLTTPATISVGTVGGSYTDIIPATALTGLTTANTYKEFPVTFPLASVAPGTAIYVNVSTGATATTYQIGVQVFGDYE